MQKEDDEHEHSKRQALSDWVMDRNLRWGWLRSLGTGRPMRLYPQTQLAMILREPGHPFCLERLRYITTPMIELN